MFLRKEQETIAERKGKKRQKHRGEEEFSWIWAAKGGLTRLVRDSLTWDVQRGGGKNILETPNP